MNTAPRSGRLWLKSRVDSYIGRCISLLDRIFSVALLAFVHKPCAERRMHATKKCSILGYLEGEPSALVPRRSSQASLFVEFLPYVSHQAH